MQYNSVYCIAYLRLSSNPVSLFWRRRRLLLQKDETWKDPTFLLRQAFPVPTLTLGFDLRVGLPRLLWSLTSTLVFDSSSGDFELQGLQLLLSLPSSFDACFGIPCVLQREASACAGPALLVGGGADTVGGLWQWQLVGAWTWCWRATSSSHLALDEKNIFAHF